MNTVDLVQKSRGGEMLSRNELVYLLNLPVDGEDTYRVMAEAAGCRKRFPGAGLKCMPSLRSIWLLAPAIACSVRSPKLIKFSHPPPK